ncbi:hypothetical protein ACFC8N_42800 [Streptomyces sp. NPDC055966]|uniref:hypothetical protein n=1 Tax=Streptomyces sp. NPDC055966 TaxID=3345669 RepID=UPI0035DC3FBB
MRGSITVDTPSRPGRPAVPDTHNFQDQGDPARRAAGIDGTAGDAQDIRHRFVRDDVTGACLLCGLAETYRKHIDRLLDCGLCYEEQGEEVHPHPECTVGRNGVLRQNPDGTWGPVKPLPLTGDFDVEVYGTGPWRWEAWAGLDRVATGNARTRFGLKIAILRARRQHSRRSRG